MQALKIFLLITFVVCRSVFETLWTLIRRIGFTIFRTQLTISFRRKRLHQNRCFCHLPRMRLPLLLSSVLWTVQKIFPSLVSLHRRMLDCTVYFFTIFSLSTWCVLSYTFLWTGVVIRFTRWCSFTAIHVFCCSLSPFPLKFLNVLFNW